MELSQDEILQILELMEDSHFDELDLKVGELAVHIVKGGNSSIRIEEPKSGSSMPKAGTHKGPAAPAIHRLPQTVEVVAEGLIEIKAPMLGTFYRRPDPGSPPYVEADSRVSEDDTVGLIEVMKVFSAVKAGVNGRIALVCAETGELVEYGQTLFLVDPDLGDKD